MGIATQTAKVSPVKTDERICFGIMYFDDEADADRAGENVRKAGITYNGGWMDGTPCGRDKSFDHVDKETGIKLFAVTY